MIIESYIYKNGKHQSSAIIDDFIQLKIEYNWQKPHKFELHVPFKGATNMLEIAQPEAAMKIDNINYFIDRVYSDGTKIEISGKSYMAKMSDRIITDNYNKQGQAHIIAQDIIRKYITGGAHPIEQIQIGQETITTETIRYQRSYAEVLDAILELAENGNFGIEEQATGATPKNIITFKQPRDLSNFVEFSEINENVIIEGLENSNFDHKNVAYVLGEGEGENRTRYIMGSTSASGIDRKELYVDAKDLRKEADGQTLSESEYFKILRERGKNKLEERGKVFQLSGTIDARSNLFEIGKDYWLGDTVKISSSIFNVKYNAQIEQITKTWNSNGGLTIDPVFGKSSPTIYQILERK